MRLWFFGYDAGASRPAFPRWSMGTINVSLGLILDSAALHRGYLHMNDKYNYKILQLTPSNTAQVNLPEA